MIKVTTSELTVLFDVDKSTLTRWKKLGADEAYTGKNEWDLKKFLTFWLSTIGGSASDQPDIAEERLRYEKGRADKIEIEVAVMRDELIKWEDVKELLSDRAVEFKRSLMGRARKLGLRIANRSSKECIRLLEKDSISILEQYSRPNNLRKKRNKK